MLGRKGSSISQLQMQMRKELQKMGTGRGKSIRMLSTTELSRREEFEQQPTRPSYKSNSTRKRDTSVTKAIQYPLLARQTSFEIYAQPEKMAPKPSRSGKLKKKLSKNQNTKTFVKLNRGVSLAEQCSGTIESYSTIEQMFPSQVQIGKAGAKTPEEYEAIIANQRILIEKLENIIESMQC